MARASLRAWTTAFQSQAGPKHQRDRHVCHVLAHHMRGDGADGCFPSQRKVAEMTAMNRRTVVAVLTRLGQEGWIETEERTTNFGRKGSLYFPAIPATAIGASMTTPMQRPNGVPSVHQSENLTETHAAIGAVSTPIGAVSGRIGAPRVHLKSLSEGSIEKRRVKESRAERIRKARVLLQVTPGADIARMFELDADELQAARETA